MNKKKLFLLILSLSCLFMLASCGQKKPDYTAKEAETALNNGDKIDGKTVSFTVTDYSPNSAFGYNLMTGKDLNFVSSDNPGVKKGAKVIVKVKEVKSLMGSWIITYEDLKEE
ncbi:lipoprotein [uncultured Ligilactobacillus sp.]|uniref:LptM family lipoprotein n=1 Tax=uncultured Ligilactobacillus sp. TaxID=2837633 RepID=UPI00351D2443